MGCMKNSQIRTISSAGRAFPLQGRGQRFKSVIVHHKFYYVESIVHCNVVFPVKPEMGLCTK